MHEPLEWGQFNKNVEKFCTDFILPVIFDGEMQKDSHNGSMMNWLTTLPLHTFEFQQVSSVKPVSLVEQESSGPLMLVKEKNDNQ